MNKSIIECLKARIRTIEKYLNDTPFNRQFSDWNCYSDENLKGRLEELKNTLDMLGIEY